LIPAVQVIPLLRPRSLQSRAFDYRVPEGAEREPLVGELVTVPFGRRRVRGVVTAIGASGEVAFARLAPLDSMSGVVLPPELLDLAGFLSEHYLAPAGASLRAVTPVHLLKEPAPEREVSWVEPVLSEGSAVPEDANGTDSGGRDPEAEPERAALTPRQREVFEQLLPEGEPVAELTRRLGTTRAVVAALVEKGYLRQLLRAPRESADLEPEDALEPPPPLALTQEQAAALTRLTEALEEGEASRALLWGVTGSGKTEVYLRLLELVLGQDGGAIVLVPEIALTLQTVNRVRERFGDQVAVLHSALPEGRRLKESARVFSGEARVVVGARSAVFAPVRDLRMIIVDEAHDASYKQEEEPRYDARTVAWWRIRQGGGLHLEGSATPRLESLHDSRLVLRLKERPTGQKLPQVEVIDLRSRGGRGVLSPAASEALRDVMRRGEQAIVLLNRRGYASFLRCPSCGEVVLCPRCEISLTYFRREGVVRCHHCGHGAEAPELCPSCGRAALERGSPGTERLSDELLQIVPRNGLFRLDSDTVTSTGRVQEVLEGFAGTRPSLLVGTQMVAKGHDFPGVTLVVVADSDTALYLPDFRAGERTFQLLAQVAGRAGRGKNPGRVLVQTWNPEVGCIRMALDQRGEAFYREESAIRRRLGYPPYAELIRILLSGKDEKQVRAGAVYLFERFTKYLADDELLGPARLPVIRRRSRWHLLLRVEDSERGRHLVERALAQLRGPYLRRGIDVMVDVEPQSFG